MRLNLAEDLKAQTRALHTELERSALMVSLLRGEMKRAPYCALLRNLHAIYEALELALQTQAGQRGVSAVYFPALFRRQALADDLRVLHGPGWQGDIPLRRAALDYAIHLNRLAANRPIHLVAHAYVRYLGDLSGGQILSRIVASSLGLADLRGTRFYDFGGPADVAARVGEFRAGLARVVDSDSDTDAAAEAAAIVAEAILAFQLHQRLFSELTEAPGLHTPDLSAAR